jgi:1,4-alpha-glucan branching enzyme
MSASADKKLNQTANARSVDFSCCAPDAKAVFVAGTFNTWRADAMPLTRGVDGKWHGSRQFPAGHHEYKFVVDGQWCCEPGCEHEFRGCPKCCANPFGSMNRVLDVKA